MNYKPRTLDQLQKRIWFLQERLQMIKDTTIGPVDDFIVKFEMDTINNLKKQLRVRIACYLLCIGC
jgi:hypothetical protein